MTVRDTNDSGNSESKNNESGNSKSGNSNSGDSVPANNDLEQENMESYQLLFEVLNEEPSVHVPYRFSSQVATVISMRRNRVNDIKFYILIVLVGIFGLGIAWLSLSMIDKNSAAVLIDLIVAYKWLWLISLSGILLVQYADQRIIAGLSQKDKNG